MFRGVGEASSPRETIFPRLIGRNAQALLTVYRKVREGGGRDRGGRKGRGRGGGGEKKGRKRRGEKQEKMTTVCDFAWYM